MEWINDLFLIAAAILGAFVAALWVSLILWTMRDLRGRTQDRILPILAGLLVALLSFPGLVIYLILRPAATLAEIYQSNLEEEALLSEIEGRSICPGCGALARSDWKLCPHCHTHLHKACSHCGRMMELPWQICPYCGESAPGSTDRQEAEELVEEIDTADENTIPESDDEGEITQSVESNSDRMTVTLREENVEDPDVEEHKIEDPAD
jgi:RNA polymerase subunit RPABC4/transcription elongation factor Spt4